MRARMVFFSAGPLLFSGCAKKEAPAPESNAMAPAPATAPAAAPAPAAGGPCALNLFIWSEYIDPEIVTAFEQQNSCKVTIDLYEDNESMMAKLQGGGTSPGSGGSAERL